MSETPVIKDKKAIEIVEKIEYDFTKFDNGWILKRIAGLKILLNLL